MATPVYEGPKALGFSKYASPAQKPSQLAAAAIPTSLADSAIATKQQLTFLETAPHVIPPAAELAIERGTALNKEVEGHTTKLAKELSNDVLNTRQLLSLLYKTTAGSGVVNNLWHELEQLFEVLGGPKAALPDFLERQCNNMSLYHSSNVNETIRKTQAELNLQRKKANTQHELIHEQQEAFQTYRGHTASSLKEFESLQERISRLTLEKGNFRTELEKYKTLLEKETTSNVENLQMADALQQELATLVSTKKQLQEENESLRKSTTDQLEQLKKVERKVTDRFIDELASKSEELQKESAKVVSLDALLSTLKSSEISTKKDFEKLKNDNRLLSVKYHNQAAEHARTSSKAEDQVTKIEALNADVARLRKQNADLQSEHAELKALSFEQGLAVDELTSQLNEAEGIATAAQSKVEALMATGSTVHEHTALLNKIEGLQEKKETLEIEITGWSKVATDAYERYKELKLWLEGHQKEAREKEAQITELKHQLVTTKPSQRNGAGAAADGDSAYWKGRYETLLSSLQ